MTLEYAGFDETSVLKESFVPLPLARDSLRPAFADCAELCTVFGAGGGCAGARGDSPDSGAAICLGRRSKIESVSGSGGGAIAMARID